MVEVTNRFKRLDLVSRVPEELQRFITLYRKTKPLQRQKKKCKKAKSEEALQIAKERREVKSNGERERSNQLKAEFHRTASRDKKPFFNEQCKEADRKNKM